MLYYVLLNKGFWIGDILRTDKLNQMSYKIYTKMKLITKKFMIIFEFIVTDIISSDSDFNSIGVMQYNLYGSL